MKKKLFVLFGVSALLLTAFQTSGSSINDAKNLYKDKVYTSYQRTSFEKPQTEETKEKDQDLILTYINQYKPEIASHTLLAKEDATYVAQSVNFNQVADNEAAWAKEAYKADFTYELKNGGVETTVATSKTVTSDADKAANNAVGIAFSYVTFFDENGLPTSTVLRFSVVKENAKNELLAKYVSVDAIYASWKLA